MKYKFLYKKKSFWILKNNKIVIKYNFIIKFIKIYIYLF